MALGLLAIEAAAVLGCVLLALILPAAGGRTFGWIERAFGALARRRRIAIVSVGLLALIGRAAILPWVPIPSPGIHDEFSYLLAADTFSAGRLTNPTHPMWISLETMHVNHKPTYMSMYPPAQGLILAAGKIIGHPWFGVWLSAAAVCAALTWMLQGWLPPGWALLGGLLAVMRIALFSSWSNSYFGGAAAAIGGALVLGGMKRHTRPGAAVMALGMAILANSRPYEGFIFCLSIAATVLWTTFQRHDMRRLLPAAAILLITALGMGYYNRRVFENALTLPYQTNRAMYAAAQVFVWQSARPIPVYRNAAMRDFYLFWELPIFLGAHTFRGFAAATANKIVTAWMFYFGPALTVPLFLFPSVLFRDRRMRFVLAASAFAVAGIAVEVWMAPHYIAPMLGLMYLILMQCMRHLRQWKPAGMLLTRAVPVICLLMCALRLAAVTLHIPVRTDWWSTWYTVPSSGVPREQRNVLLTRLNSLKGGHLVVVRYSSSHDPLREWVYNDADIDGAKIVWARELNETQNRRLLDYFKQRRVWLLEADASPPRMAPWPIMKR